MFLEEIAYLWIVCVVVTIFAVFFSISTGIIWNRARKAEVKLEVAVEALLTSSCSNPEHQLRRSALLNMCGYPSIELNDMITPIGPLQDEATANQMNEFDVLAEQIRRVQAASTPTTKSDKSVSNSTVSSKPLSK